MQRGGGGVDQVQVQKDTPRPQVIVDLTIDLADTLEVPEVAAPESPPMGSSLRGIDIAGIGIS
jgi:hypothetical protein